jgi:hypothetical protein
MRHWDFERHNQRKPDTSTASIFWAGHESENAELELEVLNRAVWLRET